MSEEMARPAAVKTLSTESTTQDKHPGVYNSQNLFHGRQEILIEHADCVYRLRITRQDKLILTK
jgi:hemin uptake protein HemP